MNPALASSKPFRMMAKFIPLESRAGILLFLTAVIALIVDNSPLHLIYQQWIYKPVFLQLGQWNLKFSTIFVVNDVLMTIFFLLVGLEIKREICVGELNTTRKVMLPAIAAVGGMVLPAIIYMVFNHADHFAMTGWAIPTATDIAFSLGIISLLGKRVPVALKMYLMALAIFDDLGAILIIAFFYQAHFSWLALSGAGICLFVLVLLNRFGVRHLSAYCLVGIVLWFFFLKSGIHPTLAGVLLALTIPISPQKKPQTLESPIGLTMAKFESPLCRFETWLHPWVAYLILPIFSFANAGVSFSGVAWNDFFSNIPLGILFGLFLGKQLGIFIVTWMAIHFKLARMPTGASWQLLYGIAMICGVGFTMSLFIGNLAFESLDAQYAVLVRFGVLAGSFLSGLVGYLLLYTART